MDKKTFDNYLASKIKSYLCNELQIDITSWGADKLSDFIVSLGYQKPRPAPTGQEVEGLLTAIIEDCFPKGLEHKKRAAVLSIGLYIEGLLASAPKPSVALDEELIKEMPFLSFKDRAQVMKLIQSFCRPALSEKAFDKKFPNGVFSLDIQSDDGSVCSHTNITEEVKEFLFYSPAIGEKRIKEVLIDKLKGLLPDGLFEKFIDELATAIRQELEK